MENEYIFRRHVLKFTITCPLASYLQILSDTNSCAFGDEDHLLKQATEVPVSFKSDNQSFILCLF